MTRMTGPDCVVMCNLINTYIHTYVLENLYRNWQQKNDAYCSLVQLRKVDHRIVPRNFEPHSHNIVWNNVPIYATSLYKNYFHEQTMDNEVHYALHQSLTHHFRSIR